MGLIFAACRSACPVKDKAGSDLLNRWLIPTTKAPRVSDPNPSKRGRPSAVLRCGRSKRSTRALVSMIRKRIVVVGAGFGGMAVSRSVRSVKHYSKRSLDSLMISRGGLKRRRLSVPARSRHTDGSPEHSGGRSPPWPPLSGRVVAPSVGGTLAVRVHHVEVGDEWSSLIRPKCIIHSFGFVPPPECVQHH